MSEKELNTENRYIELDQHSLAQQTKYERQQLRKNQKRSESQMREQTNQIRDESAEERMGFSKKGQGMSFGSSPQQKVKGWHKMLSSSGNDEVQDFFFNYKAHFEHLIEISKLKNSTNIKISAYKQSFFYGQILNSQHNGIGVMLYDTGRLYEGEWQNNLKFGKGYELYPNGNQYYGQFVNGKSEGFGFYLWANLEQYEGQWLGGYKHGSGRWKGPKGDSYVGDWKMGKVDGYGIHTWYNGNKYEGEFKTNLKHGQGKEIYSNGDCYKGAYVNGKPEGYGEYLWKNGNEYKGFFNNGLRNGKGVWRKAKEGQFIEAYEGDFINDQKSGYGKHIQGGNKYSGKFFDDLKHGYGEMRWADGSIYRGIWEKGVETGEGEIIPPVQAQKKGMQNQKLIQQNDNETVTKKQIIKQNYPKKAYKSNSHHISHHIIPLEEQNYHSNLIEEKENKKLSPISAKIQGSNNNRLNQELLDTSSQPTFPIELKNYTQNKEGQYPKNSGKTVTSTKAKQMLFIPQIFQYSIMKTPVQSNVKKQKQKGDSLLLLEQISIPCKIKQANNTRNNPSPYSKPLMRYKKNHLGINEKKTFNSIFDSEQVEICENKKAPFNAVTPNDYSNNINRSSSTLSKKTENSFSNLNQHNNKQHSLSKNMSTGPIQNQKLQYKMKFLPEIQTETSQINFCESPLSKTQSNTPLSPLLLGNTPLPQQNQQKKEIISTNQMFYQRNHKSLSPLNLHSPILNSVSPAYKTNCKTPQPQRYHISRNEELSQYLKEQEQKSILDNRSSSSNLDIYQCRSTIHKATGTQRTSPKLRYESQTNYTTYTDQDKGNTLCDDRYHRKSVISQNTDNFKDSNLSKKEMILQAQLKQKLSNPRSYPNNLNDLSITDQIKRQLNRPPWKPGGSRNNTNLDINLINMQ